MSDAVAPSTTTPTVGELARQFPEWLKKNVPTAVVSAVAGGIFGYAVNIWLMAVRYNGWQKVPKGSPATGQGNLLGGALFWAVATSVMFGVVGYWRAVGTKQFFQDVRGLPMALSTLVRRDGTTARVHLLWGAAVSLLAAQIISPAVGAMVAIGLLASAPGVLGNIVVSLIGRIWSAATQRFAPERKDRQPGVLSLTVGLVGASGALLIGFLIHNSTLKLLLAVVCAGAAIALSKKTAPPPAAQLFLLVLAGVVAYDLVHAVHAFANDGGEKECGIRIYQFGKWLSSCNGSKTVIRYGRPGGIAAAVGAPIGGFLGQVAGGWGGDDLGGGGPSPDRGPIYDPGGPMRPRVFVKGGSIYIVGPDGTMISAPLGPNNTVGQWTYAGHDADPQPTPTAAADPEALAPPAPEPVTDPYFGDPIDDSDPFDLSDLFGNDPPPGRGDGPRPAGHRPQRGAGDPQLHRRQHQLEHLRPEPLHPAEQPADPAGFRQLRAGRPGCPRRSDAGDEPQRPTDHGQPGRHHGPDLSGRIELHQPAQPAGFGRRGCAPGGDGSHRQAGEVGHRPHGRPPSGAGSGDSERPRPAPRREPGRHAEGPAGADHLDVQHPVGRQRADRNSGRPRRHQGQRAHDRCQPHQHRRHRGRGCAAVSVRGARSGRRRLAAGRLLPRTQPHRRGRRGVRRRRYPRDAARRHQGRRARQPGLVHLPRRQRRPDPPLDPQGHRQSRAARGSNRVDAQLAQRPRSCRHQGHPSPQQRRASQSARHRWGQSLRSCPEGGPGERQGVPATQRRAQRVEVGWWIVEAIADLQAQVENKVFQINGDYQAKVQLKAMGSDVQKEFSNHLEPALQQAQAETVNALNDAGYTRAGRPIIADDLVDIRNAKSMGTVGMDRDLALNQLAERQMQAQLQSMPPGPQADALRAQLDQLAERGMIMGPNGQPLLDANGRAITGGQFQLNGEHVNPTDVRVAAQGAYNQEYQQATRTSLNPNGYEAGPALQGVTDATHPEAYHDLNVLQNDPSKYPLNSGWGEQTGSVTSYKGLTSGNELDSFNALQETARGTTKDIDSKLLPLLNTNGATPEVMQRVEDVRSFLNDVGKGKYLPSDAQALAQSQFGTNIQGLTDQMSSNIAASIRQIPPVPASNYGNFPQYMTDASVNLAQNVPSLYDQQQTRNTAY